MKTKLSSLLDKPLPTPPNSYQGPHFSHLNHRLLHQVQVNVLHFLILNLRTLHKVQPTIFRSLLKTHTERNPSTEAESSNLACGFGRERKP